MFQKLITLFVVLFSLITLAQPGTYYNTVTPGSGSFITDLQSRIRSPYTRISYDQFDETNVEQFAAYDTTGGKRVVKCVYSGYLHVYTPPFAWTPFSREHTFCHSWMPSNPSTNTNEYADQHHLFPTHQNGANGVRSNHPLGIVSNVTSTFQLGKYGTNTNGEFVYEPKNDHKGDAARALLYMVIRYDGVSGTWNFNWLNNTRLPSLSEAPQSLSLLLQWHREDPPDRWEIERNDYIQTIQKNRNPFVDMPEYANFINFNDNTLLSPTLASEPTNHPSAFATSVSGSNITLNWSDAVAGSVTPTGYLIVAYSHDNYFIPVDGTEYSDDSNLGDGTARVNVSYSGADNYTFNSLSNNTKYYFTIFSYNGSGSSRNYKTWVSGTSLVQASGTVGTVSSIPTVNFNSTVGNISEGAGTFSIPVSIANPSASQACSVQVALTTGAASNIGNYTTQTVVFPAGSSSIQYVALTVTNDTLTNGNRSLVFALQNVSGAAGAVIGSSSNFTLTIQDDETGSGTNSTIINNKDYVYYQDFNLFSTTAGTWTDNSTIPGWYSSRTTFLVGTGSANTGGLYNFGVSGSADRALGSVASGTSGTIYTGVSFTNNAGETLTDFDIQYVGEQWRAGSTAANTMKFEYKINATALTDATGWTEVPSLNFTSPVLASTGAIDGNTNSQLISATINSISLPVGSTFWVRFTDVDDASSDQGLAVDNFSLKIAEPLPVELTTFTAEIENTKVKLQWQTATEINNYGFQIERKVNAGAWDSIGFMPGAGNSNVYKNYAYSDDNLSSKGVYSYRLKQLDHDGSFSYSPTVEVDYIGLTDFTLEQNYPNPFNPETMISFTLPNPEYVSLNLYSSTGELIQVLSNGYFEAGKHQLQFNATDLSSGVYVYTLSAGTFYQSRKMMLLK